MSTGGLDQFGLLPDTSRADLEAAWPEREAEAALLAAAGLRAMAASLRCYALEVRIKALICLRLNLDYLPRACKTHDLKELIIFTGLRSELFEPANGLILVNWDRLTNFSAKYLNVLRYQPNLNYPLIEANQLDAALDDPQHGVLAWLSKPR